MAYEIPFHKITLEAGSDMSADVDKLVVLASDGQIDVATTVSTQPVIGVLQNKPAAAGRAASVAVQGILRVICGESIDEGNLLTASAVTAGRVDVANGSTNVVIGRALQSGEAGEVISALINCSGAAIA